MEEPGVVEQPPKKSLGKLIVAAVVLVAVVAGGLGYYSYGPCGTQRVSQARDEVVQLAEEWDDAVVIAGSTSRISLSGPIGDMQSIRRRLGDIETPGCMGEAVDHLDRAMDLQIDAFVAFLGQEPDSTVSSLMQRSGFAVESFALEMGRVLECAPFCD